MNAQAGLGQEKSKRRHGPGNSTHNRYPWTTKKQKKKKIAEKSGPTGPRPRKIKEKK